MFDHLSITATDLDRAQKFYDAILAPLGVPLQWFVYFLAVTAALTVVQRILSVRKQLQRKEADGFDQR